MGRTGFLLAGRRWGRGFGRLRLALYKRMVLFDTVPQLIQHVFAGNDHFHPAVPGPTGFVVIGGDGPVLAISLADQAG